MCGDDLPRIKIVVATVYPKVDLKEEKNNIIDHESSSKNYRNSSCGGTCPTPDLLISPYQSEYR